MATEGTGEIPPSEALAAFERREDSNAPLTATEVADELGCARRTAYNKLERLAERGDLASKKVGARGRVWWRPAGRTRRTNAGERNPEGGPEPPFFERTLDSMEDAVFVFEEDGDPVWWNDRFRSITGYTDEEIAGMVPSDFLPDGEELIAEMVETAVDTGGVVIRDSRLVTADGDGFPLELEISTLADEDGTVRALVATGRDVTERERALSEVRAQRDRFAALFASIPEPAVHVVFEDDEPIVRNVNAAFESTFGYAVSGIAGESVNDLIVPDGLDAEADRLDHIAGDGEELSVEVSREAADGIRDFLLRSSSVEREDGRTEGFGIYLDVTDRKERERELLQYESIVGAMRDSTYVTDRDLRVRFVNERFVESTGRSPEEFVGRSLSFLIDELTDDSLDVEELIERIEPLLSGERDETRVETNGYTDTVGTYTAETRFVPYEVADEVRGVVGVSRDITRRKRHERRLSALQDATRRLMEATTRDDVFETGIDAAETVLGIDVAAFYGTDEDGVLEPLSTTDDVRDHPGVYNPETDVRSELILPVDDHGVFVAGSPDVGAFDDVDESIAKMLVSSVEAALDRARRESLLRERGRELEQYETMVNRSGDMIYATDADGHLTAINDATLSLVGYSREELIGEHASAHVTEETVSRGREAISELLSSSERETATYEMELITADGDRVPCEDHVSLLSPGPDGEFRGTVGVVRDISERKRRERTIEELHDASRRFMDAETREEVSEAAVETSRRILDLPLSAMWLYDADADVLRPTAWTDRVEETIGELSVYTAENSLTGRAFESGETRVYEDVSTEPNRHHDTPDSRSLVMLPIGDYGVLNVGSLGVGSVDDVDVSSARLLAANVEAALSRAEREEEREEYRRTLERQRDVLATVNRINALIEDVFDSLTEAASREAIDGAVCTRLADSELYENAWIAERTAGGGIAHRAGSGVDDEFLNAVDRVETGGVDRTIRTGTTQVVESIADDPIVPDRIRELAIDRGFRSCLIVPIAYADTVYGALIVNASRPNAFGERERAAFETLGRVVGFAINAENNRNLLLSDTAVELEFLIDRGGPFFLSVSDRLDCTITLEGVVPVDGKAVLSYLDFEGATSESVLELIESEPDVSDPRVITDGDDGCAIECVIRGSSAMVTLLEYGAVVRTARAEHGAGRLVARVAPEVDVRDVVESLRAEFPEFDLARKRTVEPSNQSLSPVRETITDRLTGKQMAALRAALLAGYYEHPRGSTAQEIADSLGIASSTFHQHLQAAQRKVLGTVLDRLPR